MTIKIITFLSTFLINVAIGVAMVFFLILSLNGFNERDAHYAFAVFTGGGVLIGLMMATAAFLLVKFLIGKQWNPYLAAALSVLGFVLLGFALKFVLFFAAIFAADLARTSR